MVYEGKTIAKVKVTTSVAGKSRNLSKIQNLIYCVYMRVCLWLEIN